MVTFSTLESIQAAMRSSSFNEASSGTLASGMPAAPQSARRDL